MSKWRLGWKKRGWTKADKKPIKNLELIQEIDRAMEGRRVTFEWVKGHAGHRMNERADDLARGCAEAYQAGRTPEPGPGFGGGSSRGATPAGQASAGQASGGAAAGRAVPASVEVRDAVESGASTPAEQQHAEADRAAAVPARPSEHAEEPAAAPTSASASRSASTDEATADRAMTSTFRSHPSVFSAPTEASEPAEEAPASSVSEPAITTEDAVAREREFILAWTGGDEVALAGMTDARTTRIWPGGGATTTLAGPSPASPSIGRIDAHDLGGSFLTRYRVRWEGGASLESSVWAPATSGEVRLIMVHHQSTLIG